MSEQNLGEQNLVGGSAADRAEILKLHGAYIDVNTRFDWENLQPLFSPSPEATYFNLNGHTYRGREHWIRLWKFYGQQVQSTYWTPFDIGGVVTGDLAVVWCHRKTRRQWTGKEPPPRDIHYDNSEFVSRSTMVFRKEDGTWRVVHAHFSPADGGPRPGGV
jgi:ketosteroid isomerase-like protein